MPVKQTIPYNEGVFFITFTCHKWMPLIDLTNSHDLVYKWFDYLKSKGHSFPSRVSRRGLGVHSINLLFLTLTNAGKANYPLQRRCFLYNLHLPQMDAIN
jgi:hypothetical protein